VRRKWQGAIPIGIAAAAALAFPGIASAAVQAHVNNGVLTVTGAGSDAITIACTNGNVDVTGVTLAPVACNTITAINVTGGDGANVITLTGVTDATYTALTQTTIHAGAGNDQIFGSERIDRMHGEGGNDQIIGDDNPVGTRDEFFGEAGDDLLIWRGGEDDDAMDGGDGADTVQVNGAPVTESFTLNASATAGHATFDRAATPGPGPFNIDITASERLDMNLNGGDDAFESGAGIAALGLHADVEGADGNDTITGSDAADLIDGGAGNDRIVPNDNPAGTRDDARGGDGDDTIVWNGGDDDDLNEGGAGNDVSEVNGAPADERFTIKPSTAAGRVLFDRLATPGPGPFNIDIGTTETLHLLANAGNDRIKGFRGVDGRIRTILDAGDGNDRVRGTDAIDAISAGKGHDIVNSIDRAEDTVSCDQGIDLALVDRRDFLRQCELVIGGVPRVAIKGTAQLDGNRVALRLKCVATARCKSVVKLKRAGKLVGKGKATLKRGESRDVEIVLNKRGRRVLSEGDRVKVQVVSKDKRGNGWRSAKTVRLG
jgi:Ca2+-binding RTX toxin-like protein